MVLSNRLWAVLSGTVRLAFPSQHQKSYLSHFSSQSSPCAIPESVYLVVFTGKGDDRERGVGTVMRTEGGEGYRGSLGWPDIILTRGGTWEPCSLTGSTGLTPVPFTWQGAGLPPRAGPLVGPGFASLLYNSQMCFRSTRIKIYNSKQ